MIVKMKPKQHYQDAQVHLEPEKEYEVGVALGQWLIDNKKAVIIIKHLDVEPQFEQAEIPPKPVEVKSKKFRKLHRSTEAQHD